MLKIQHAFEIKNKLHWFLLILLISPRLNPSIIFAQHYFYCNYQTFGEKDGYQCFSTPGLITEDKNGLIWIGGDNGLYCFDGTHFKNYRHSKSDTNSLPFNLANFNYQDNHGNYWVYVVNNGLFNFYPRYGNFKKLTYSNQEEFNVHQYNIQRPFEDKLGHLWFIIPGFGLAQWNEQYKKILPYKICPPGSCGGYNNTSWVTSAIEDTSDNTFWIGSNDGLVHFFPNSGNYSVYRDSGFYKIRKDSLNNIYNYVFFDAAHTLWLGTWGRGIKKFDPLTGTFEEYRWEPDVTGTHNICRGIYQYDNEHLWIASLDLGLLLFNIKTKQFTRLKKPNEEKEFGSVSAILQTTEKVLWCLDEKRQLLRINPSENYFHYYHLNLHSTNGDEGFISTFCRKGNTLYYGSLYNGHLQKYDYTTGSSKIITLSETETDQSISSLKEDANGIIWVASQVGTYLLDPVTEKISQPTLNKEQQRKRDVFKYKCREILHDRDGTHWLATSQGLIHYNAFTQTIQEFSTTAAGKKRLKNDNILTLFQDKAGNIWFSSIWGAPACYHKDKDEIIYFNNLHSEQSGSNNYISIAQTEEGKMLFVLEHIGFDILEYPFSNKEKVTLLNSADGLPSDYISHIYKDKQQHFWLFTSNGVCYFNPATNKVISFNKEDGLLENLSDSKPYQDSSGNMYIGFNNSFQIFNPDSLLKNTIVPVTIYLSTLWINGKELPLSPDTISTLKLTYIENNINFNFAALSPGLRNDFHYAYKLTGINKDWVYTGTQASGQYTNLPHGKYVLNIKASDHNGNWVKNIFQLPIIIAPPWYQTWWFYTLLGLALFAVLYAFYRYRINQIMQIEKMRARIASDLHDDIGSTLTSISYYSELVKMQLKEEDAPLKLFLEKIGNNARNMVVAMSDIVWIINPKNDTTNNLISRMKHYAAEMLGERNIQYSFNTNEDIEKLKLNMQQRKNLYLIYKEAVHNAVKYAHCSKVEIDFEQADHSLSLSINDDGKGFNTQQPSEGNGLVNMKRRAEEIKADFEISSLIGKGTQLQVICKIT